jgi:hypothetical protein
MFTGEWGESPQPLSIPPLPTSAEDISRGGARLGASSTVSGAGAAAVGAIGAGGGSGGAAAASVPPGELGGAASSSQSAAASAGGGVGGRPRSSRYLLIARSTAHGAADASSTN